MSVLNLSEDMVECPLCMEPLEMDDLNFFPCTCGYQICRFCWHRIRTDENGLCPACRKAYPENPADFKPLSPEEISKINKENHYDRKNKEKKIVHIRKESVNLENIGIVDSNLLYILLLNNTKIEDLETLRKPDYFGKFGKIHKVVINHTTSYAGSQGPSASAYVTYQRAEDALRAIQAVNNIHVDGRTLKASLGTTKYCSHFMKNQQCPKPDCMYLHELGDEAASFTKEEMQQGKHQEFEKKLQDQYLGTGAITPDKIGCSNPVCSNSSSSSSISSSSSTNSISNGTSALTVCTSSHKRSISTGGKENSAPKSLTMGGGEVGSSSGSAVREAWPSLSAPPPTKESKKSKGSKSDRNHSSSRHSPTEEHNNNKRETRGSKERDRLGHSMSGSSNSVNSTNGSTSSNTNGSSILGSSVGDSGDHLRGLSPVGHNSPVSSQDSCTSSASTTPPPTCTDSLLHTPPSPPPSDHTSPISVTTGIDIHNPHHHHHHHHHHHPSSPLTTPPSSLSSSSEPSSSLPLPQGFPSHHSATPTGAPQPTPASSSSSLFSDNSNSFFS
ncbi:unnamed protein product, partial [Meganyctiphanes norvegica]